MEASNTLTSGIAAAVYNREWNLPYLLLKFKSGWIVGKSKYFPCFLRSGQWRLTSFGPQYLVLKAKWKVNQPNNVFSIIWMCIHIKESFPSFFTPISLLRVSYASPNLSTFLCIYYSYYYFFYYSSKSISSFYYGMMVHALYVFKIFPW